MSKLLSKRDRKFLYPAIVYGWEIRVTPWRKTALWDDDPIMPVKVGAVAQSLIERGYMEVLRAGYGCEIIRATKKAKELRCGKCRAGDVIGDDGRTCGTCPHCEYGVKLIEDKS